MRRLMTSLPHSAGYRIGRSRPTVAGSTCLFPAKIDAMVSDIEHVSVRSGDRHGVWMDRSPYAGQFDLLQLACFCGNRGHFLTVGCPAEVKPAAVGSGRHSRAGQRLAPRSSLRGHGVTGLGARREPAERRQRGPTKLADPGMPPGRRARQTVWRPRMGGAA
jgi:hypothetical protein